MTPLEREMRVPHVCVIGCKLSIEDHWPKEPKTMLSRDERLMSAIERLIAAVERVAAAYERAFPPPPAYTFIPYNPYTAPPVPNYPTTTPFPQITCVSGTATTKTEATSHSQADGFVDGRETIKL